MAYTGSRRSCAAIGWGGGVPLAKLLGLLVWDGGAAGWSPYQTPPYPGDLLKGVPVAIAPSLLAYTQIMSSFAFPSPLNKSFYPVTSDTFSNKAPRPPISHSACRSSSPPTPIVSAQMWPGVNGCFGFNSMRVLINNRESGGRVIRKTVRH